jgi:predicted signal transduction protein with EAL and GGDEF domain
VARYRVKCGGKARFEPYTPALTVDAATRLDVENDLRRAPKGDQFIVHYQPILDTSSGVPVGAEALVRWQHPVGDMVAPALEPATSCA